MPTSDKALDQLITSAKPEPRRPMQLDAEAVLSAVEMRKRTGFGSRGALGFGRLGARRPIRSRRVTLGTSVAALAAVVLAAGGVYAVTDHRSGGGFGVTSGGPGAVQTYISVPLAQNYAASFSFNHGSQFLTPPPGQVQTQFKVKVSDWNSRYDASSYAVYVLVTNTTTPVVGLETSNSQNFAYPGWFDPVSMNRRLQSLGLQPPSEINYGGTMLTVINATSATSVFDVRTKQPVRPQDWRLVIMAIGGRHGNVHVLWTKQMAPS